MGTFPKVEKVSEGSIAQKAGIQVHDIVLEVSACYIIINKKIVCSCH